MKKLFLLLAVLTATAACTQVDADQYKATGLQPVYNESNGVFYDATNDRLSMFINDVEVAYFDTSGNIVLDGAYTAADVTATDDLISTDDTAVGDALNVTGITTCTGDVVINGGAGALTCGASCAILAEDNAAAGLDIGTTGATSMMRFDTQTGVETINLRAPVVRTGIYETFGEGATKGLSTLETDGTATTGAAGVPHLSYLGSGNILGYVAIGDNAADDIDMTAAGLNIANDQADNEGREVWSGYAGATGRPFVIGTDAAFSFLTSIKVGDIDGTDTVFCGFRKLEAHNATFTSYDTYFGIGANTSADPMVLKVIEELNGAAGALTDTTDTLQDATVLQIKVLVDSSGNATAQIDADTPGTLEAPDTTSAFQFDDGDLVIPYCHYLEHNAGGLSDTFEIGQWVVGFQ